MQNSIYKILISGATGFIGSHLTRRLIKEGYNVAIIKRRNSNIWRIKDLIDKIVSYDTDLQDTDEVIKVVIDFQPTIIFHLAAYYAVDHEPEEISSMIETNVLGTINLLEAAKEAKIELFVNTSSCFVYEQNAEKIKEDANLKPLNLYALTKIHTEQACSFYAEKYRIKTITFRLFPPYGPADHERRLIPYVIKSFYQGKPLKLTSGMQKWDFTYVDDIVDAYVRLLSASNLPDGHDIFNIGTGKAASIREVVLWIKELMGITYEPEWGALPHRQNEVWFICAEISKAKAFLNWQPSKILKEGIGSTVKYYKSYLEKGGEE